MFSMFSEGESVLFEGAPERAILNEWLFTKCFVFSCVATFIIFWACFYGGIFYQIKIDPREEVAFNFLIPCTIVVFIAAFLLSAFYSIKLRKTFRYYITNERCISEGGILVKRRKSVPYQKITDIEISQNIIERCLNVYSLHIFTIGSGNVSFPWFLSKAKMSFVGLKDAEKPEKIISNILQTYNIVQTYKGD